jgi:aarF domain-containing kinase
LRPRTSHAPRRYLHVASPKFLPTQTLATLSGSPFLSSLETYRNNRIQNSLQETDDHSASVILACSSVAANNDPTLLRRWLRWFQRWLQTVWKAFLVATRITEVAVRLSPLAILTPAAVLSGSRQLSNLAWRYTISTMQGLGPVAVKFCQWMATRRDMFPPHWCDRLSVLHDQGNPHPWKYTRNELTDAFGDYESKGLHIKEDDVIGCGSAAQVYRGRLTAIDARTGKESVRTVAVKVLHPNFSKMVQRDLELMQSVAEFLHSLPTETIKMLNFPRATENFGGVLQLQADLTNEATNLEQFRTNFYHDFPEEQSSIRFPKPFPGWSSRNVLVEDYVHEATPIANFLRDSTPDGLKLRRELAGPLLRAFLKMVFMDNFIHGDLHPGNVMVKSAVVPNEPNSFLSIFNFKQQPQQETDATTHVKRTIVFLDAGIANSLSPDDQRNLRDLFSAVIFNNGDRAGRLMIERAKYERCSQVPGGVDAFAKGVQEIVSEFHDRRKEGLTLGAVRIGSLLSRVLDLCRVHGVEIDPAMASVVISTLVLEGLGRSLSPELNLIDFAKPFVLGRGRV